jgi:leucyl-tRNA synthetase
MKYQPQSIEKKWRAYWAEHKTYAVSNTSSRPKFYVLDMFPYPSGAGLHVGHPLGYVASDIYARYKRLEGYNVLHPMGYDAFGLPAEQYAIQTGTHPAVATAENVKRYRSQLERIGLSYDWDRELSTCDPQYYRWTQWIFLKLFGHFYDLQADKARSVAELVQHFEMQGTNNLQAACSKELQFSATDWAAYSPLHRSEVLMNYRLAYRQATLVNWCEALGTVLANDEVKDGFSERGGHPVERRPMLQWSLRITAYAERLLRDLDTLQWSDAMKKMQSNWIGRSEGAQIFFQLEEHDEAVEVFTTRPDTIFGATFMVLAPEHELVSTITTAEQQQAIEQYLQYTKTRSERERMAETKEITGAFTGAYARNPFTGAPIPVWIADYVLKDYGTGAIMAVPSNDDRDHRFAQHFQLPIVEVIDQSAHPGAERQDKVGKLINSGLLNGLEVPAAIERALQEVEQQGLGKRRINFRLRDAIYSRQRYWGEPFPIVYSPEGIPEAIPESELPLELPNVDDFSPKPGSSPLARATDWVKLPNGYTRETDTMPGFAGSSWYFLRYMDPHNTERFASEQALQYWQDVDLYVGGTEHAVGHLMYARFWNKFLFDLGLVPVQEPFKKLVNQGMIQGVIESLYLQKEKLPDGRSRFVCARMVEPNDPNFVQINVYVDFVSQYGAPHSHLDEAGIARFIEWRPEYAESVFESPEGRYERGQLHLNEGAEGFKLQTRSEVGKMSKRYHNVINPDDVIEQYGADCFRLYEMFLGPIEQAKPWDTQGISGVSNFLRRFWELFHDEDGNWQLSEEAPNKDEFKALHTCIKKVQDDIERFSFNTCVSAFMVATNELRRLQCRKRAILQPLLTLLAPFAPHITEELWHRMGHTKSIHHAKLPELDSKWLVEDTISYPVNVNGKKRALLDFSPNASKEALEAAALELPEIQKWIDGQPIKKVIIVPGKMVNFVV